MVLAGGAALKGCAARTGKPTSALDRDTAATRSAMTPLWRIAWQPEFLLTEHRSCEGVGAAPTFGPVEPVDVRPS
jgi:hypothetical protein